MTSSMLRLICPNLKCRCVLSVPQAARGKTVRCRQCGTRLAVPASAAVAAASETSPTQADAAR